MFKKLRSFAQEASAYVTFWPMLGGTALMTILSGWAASATTLLHPYAPFSWVAAGVLGGLSFMAVLLAGAAFRNIIIKGNVLRSFYQSGDRINPLQDVFQRVRIRLEDLAPPIGLKISGKTFTDCELVGPMNLVMAGSTLQSCGFSLSDMVRVTAPDAQSFNALLFENCNFINCKFFKVTLLVPAIGVPTVEAGFQTTIKWLNPPNT